MPGSRLYYVHPLLAGPIDAWAPLLDRVAAMRFDAVGIAPPFAPGRDGDLFTTADYQRLDSRLGQGDATPALARFATACRKRGLRPVLDVAMNRVATEQTRSGLSKWYRADRSDDAPDPRQPPQQAGVARLASDGDLNGLVEWWQKRFNEWADAGITDFRCLWPHLVPSQVWRELIAAVRARHPRAGFTASPDDAADSDVLAECGFDRFTSSSSDWDYRTEGFSEAIARLTHLAGVIAMPEVPFQRRLSRGFRDMRRAERAARRALAFSTAYGAGWLMPMGFEYGAARDMDSARDQPEDFARAIAEAPFDLTVAITSANAANAAGEAETVTSVRSLTPPEAPATALLVDRHSNGGADHNMRVVLVNASLDDPVRVPLSPLLTESGIGGAVIKDDEAAAPAGPDSVITIGPGAVRALRIAKTTPVRRAEMTAIEAAAKPRVGIEAVAPSVDGGRFAVKRLVGELVEVSADLISDGHDRIGAALLWRPADEEEWREVPMLPTGNDRWVGRFPLSRIGRHLFTIVAWKDQFASFAEELEKKHAAGQPIDLELEEGRLLVLEVASKADRVPAADLEALVRQLAEETDPTVRRRLLLAPTTAQLIATTRVRPQAAQYPTEFPVEAERRGAGFASWYELFPRSETDDPSRHGTFADVIKRLPAISGMGFDVLYFPPISPIGQTNRKGKDNATRAEPSDVGSPYAIGGAEGGHDAILPALGTLNDFRRLRDEAARQGIELAIDFAVQCSPDHPWLREHPEWFDWRPDGSIRYAENPPKKYEDIVNVNFYAEGSVPALWMALRDVVLFWAGEGVRLFRVDNPHTKPLPFWEWMIEEVRARFPESVFLAEAFTRPKLMYRLAKVGFSQSYTYFTWRNTKYELTEYMTELTTSGVREFFRPHFFVNTPDINPVFLQTSGRPGFLIRAGLAATLSGLFGVYNGFELCEAAALPGREEYASSEKYEIRVRDWDAPGNIVAEITQLNRIRRGNPALQTHLGLSFHNAFNDQILYYSKATPDLQNVVLVAVNLDPRFSQECDIEVPVWLWGLPDSASVAVIDLMAGHQFTWTGKIQHIRLDPAVMPFAVWRIRPTGGVPQ